MWIITYTTLDEGYQVYDAPTLSHALLFINKEIPTKDFISLVHRDL